MAMSTSVKLHTSGASGIFKKHDYGSLATPERYRKLSESEIFQGISALRVKDTLSDADLILLAKTAPDEIEKFLFNKRVSFIRLSSIKNEEGESILVHLVEKDAAIFERLMDLNIISLNEIKHTLYKYKEKGESNPTKHVLLNHLALKHAEQNSYSVLAKWIKQGKMKEADLTKFHSISRGFGHELPVVHYLAHKSPSALTRLIDEASLNPLKYAKFVGYLKGVPIATELAIDHPSVLLEWICDRNWLTLGLCETILDVERSFIPRSTAHYFELTHGQKLSEAVSAYEH